MSDILIGMKDITFTYGAGAPVFSHFNFQYSGGRLGISGKNGCGKTTFFALLMGLFQPKSGQVMLDNKPILTEKDFYEMRKRVGYVFQDANDQLFCPTVQEDIAFGCYNLGMKKDLVEQSVNNISKTLQIDHLLMKSPFNLSGGEKKLVSIATVLVMNPDVVLFDEPSTHLDQDSLKRLTQIMNTLPNTIVVSHDSEFLQTVCQQFLSI